VQQGGLTQALAAKMNRPLSPLSFIGAALATTILTTWLLATGWRLYFAQIDAEYRENNPRHVFPVTLTNKMTNGYIWVSDEVGVAIWYWDADASYDPEQVMRGRLKLNAKSVGPGFIILANQSVKGSIELPQDFQLNRYIRKKNDIVMSSRAIENDIYAGARPFNPGPGEMDGNASSKIEMTEQTNISSVDFTYSNSGS